MNIDKYFGDNRIKMNEGEQLDGMILRRATLEDVQHFDEIARIVHFDQGLHNWLVYYDICGAKEFFVLVDPKLSKIVGILTGNRVNEDLFYGHQVVILPEYRQKNTFHRVMGKNYARSKYKAVNQNASSIAVFRNEPSSFGHKQIGFSGQLFNKTWTVKPPNGITVTKINKPSLVDQTLLSNLYKYDAELYKNIPAPNRHRWLVQWCFPQDPLHSSTVVAYDSKSLEVFGFGVGRLLTEGFYALSPLYANSEEIAYALLCEVANQLKDRHCNVYMEFHANRRSCFRFAKEAGFLQTYSNFRVYMPCIYEFPIEKLYCDNEFWPM